MYDIFLDNLKKSGEGVMLRVHTVVPVRIVVFFLMAFLFASSSTRYEVTGVLVDQNKAPLAGLSVILLNENEEQIDSDISDNHGFFTLAYQVEPTSVNPLGNTDLPSEFKLGASYPNPFNPRTTVPFYAPENTRAVIAVYNIIGQEVLHTQVDVSAGSHEIQVNLGGRLSQGQYLLRVSGNDFSLTQMMTFISAGVSSGSSGIALRPAGGQEAAPISSQIQSTSNSSAYRLVVVGGDAFNEKELAIPVKQNYDTGEITLVRKDYPLIITIEGEGSVEEEIVTAKNYEHGTVVRLTAVPAEGWWFVEWSGDAEGTSSSVEITVDRERTVMATFRGTTVVDVTNPATGRIWMDRNLGASSAATSSTDSQAYGDLYQWGRGADGHQLRNSPTTTILSSSDQPGHGSYIIAPDPPRDWRIPQNDNLWQGVNGINNPCPAGYRLPTEAEWEAERGSWSSNNAAGAFASPLKLPVAGRGLYESGAVFADGENGYYWSSTISGSLAWHLYFTSSDAQMFSNFRARGISVRCIKH